MRFRPCIDLHNGNVKQIVGSTLTDSNDAQPATNFVTERPASFFAALYRKDNLPGGHVIMLGPGNENAAREAIRAFPGGMQVGGGITPDNARSFLDEGASHVIVTSYVFSGDTGMDERLSLLEKTIGRKRLVLDLSCRNAEGRYIIASKRWQESTGVSLDSALASKLSDSCDEFLVHAVDVEGKVGGIDAGLVQLLADISPVPVTYAGGIRSIQDLEQVLLLGSGRVDATIGSALDIFGGTLSYREVVSWQRKHDIKLPASGK